MTEAPYPERGLLPYDGPLKEYIDQQVRLYAPRKLVGTQLPDTGLRDFTPVFAPLVNVGNSDFVLVQRVGPVVVVVFNPGGFALDSDINGLRNKVMPYGYRPVSPGVVAFNTYKDDNQPGDPIIMLPNGTFGGSFSVGFGVNQPVTTTYLTADDFPDFDNLPGTQITPPVEAGYPSLAKVTSVSGTLRTGDNTITIPLPPPGSSGYAQPGILSVSYYGSDHDIAATMTCIIVPQHGDAPVTGFSGPPFTGDAPGLTGIGGPGGSLVIILDSTFDTDARVSWRLDLMPVED